MISNNLRRVPVRVRVCVVHWSENLSFLSVYKNIFDYNYTMGLMGCQGKITALTNAGFCRTINLQKRAMKRNSRVGYHSERRLFGGRPFGPCSSNRPWSSAWWAQRISGVNGENEAQSSKAMVQSEAEDRVVPPNFKLFGPLIKIRGRQLFYFARAVLWSIW